MFGFCFLKKSPIVLQMSPPYSYMLSKWVLCTCRQFRRQVFIFNTALYFGLSATSSAICLIHMCDMTHSYVWHDSFICVTWLIHMCDMTHSYSLSATSSAICLIHMCDMTHSYVWHDSFIRLVSDIICSLSYSYVWHDSFICVTWLIHMCDMTHSYVWHDSFLRLVSDTICSSWVRGALLQEYGACLRKYKM